jgi:aminocarboxymuconate-semialdehyde decarboxylase
VRVVVDHHAHFVPPGYRDAVAELAADDPWADAAAVFLSRFGADGSAPRTIASLEHRVDVLDAAGIDVQVLSLGASTIWHHDPDVRGRLADAFNEGALTAASTAPERFAVFASVPLPHIEITIAASEDLARTAGVAGFGITAHPAGRALDDPYWRPVLECWSSLRATVFVHPDPPAAPVLWDPYWLRWGVGALVEDALAAVRLIAGAIPREFPGIRWIVPHAGGGLATMLSRLDFMWRSGRLPSALTQPPSASLDGIWFDTATTDPVALRSAADAFGGERLVFGTDHPLGESDDLRVLRDAAERAAGEAVLRRDLRSFRP